MSAAVSYRSTVFACYVGTIVQAIVINLTAILFIPLREQFGLSYAQLGFLVFVNFVTQVTVDLVFSHPADRWGYRPFIVAAPVLTIAGFVLFAFTPRLFPEHPYAGFLIATLLFAGAGGLLELLLSPILNAIPTDEKAAAMSVMHSFYAWGWLLVVLVTTVLLWVFGRESWPWIVLGWTLFPLVNFLQFIRVPLAPTVPHEDRLTLAMLVREPFFVVCVLTILLGGASEVAIAQWTSAFMERVMMLPKLLGDVAGVCLLAAALGIGRVLYGIYGGQIHVATPMRIGALVAMLCYVVIAISNVPAVSLVACGVCGLAVSLLWPGTLSLAAERFPLASTWLFALLAAGGDIGAAVGPWLIGLVTQAATTIDPPALLAETAGWTREQFALRAGVLSAAVFPLGCFVCLQWMKRHPAKATLAPTPGAADPLATAGTPPAP
jgi:fucose permease